MSAELALSSAPGDKLVVTNFIVSGLKVMKHGHKFKPLFLTFEKRILHQSIYPLSKSLAVFCVLPHYTAQGCRIYTVEVDLFSFNVI